MDNQNVIVIGGINVDIKGKSECNLIKSTSNVGTIEISAGGVARNIAENLAYLGVNPILLGVIGEDLEGNKILNTTARSGVNIEHVIRSTKFNTGTYLAILDNHGEMNIAMSDMRILDTISEEYVLSKSALIKRASFVICDTNIPSKSLGATINIAKNHGIPVCVEPVSVTKAVKILDHLSKIDIITPNIDELEVLSDRKISFDSNGKPQISEIVEASNVLIAKGIKYVLTTLERHGICFVDKFGNKRFECFDTEVLDVTGAGDSLTAGYVYGAIKCKNVDEACISSLAAAAITVASKETVSPYLSIQNIQAVIANKKWSQSMSK